MPAELPGYYFDVAKNRYFKIQPNHIAPLGSKYSREAVRTEKVIKKAQRRDELQYQSKLASTVTRSKLLQHPLLTFDRRLGHLRKSAGSLVAAYYAAGLERKVVVRNPIAVGGCTLTATPQYRRSLRSGSFCIEEPSGILFGDCRSWRMDGRQDCTDIHAFYPRSPYEIGELLDGRDSLNWPTPLSHDTTILYSHKKVESIGRANGIRDILSVGSGLVVWSEDGFNPQHPEGTMVKVGACSVGPFADRHGLVHQASFAEDIRNLAVQPGDYTVALASERGLYLMDLFHASYPLTKYPLGTNELVKATFKDRNIIMGGTRSGKMLLCDIRAAPPPTKGGRTTATRLQHTDLITGLAALPDGNQILISGLKSMKIYDLRFAPQPSLMCHLPRSNSFKASPAVLDFNIPFAPQYRHSWKGFAYDPELNIVLRASSDSGGENNCAALWSASTGRLLQSPLSRERFHFPIDDTAIARVRDGPKSIFISTGNMISEWTLQGRGSEGDQE
ncbi:uncharacterized protein Z519_06356 [Cladophialophora bantiana CBS 173.52]|uniref:Myocyte-specific enhancer factor 2d n=1 Tax=Cladophialophora bantiana (strain ATCC 10958 / CBS 173.52 / CDC B-1940 / NIH 8579) TaxID=1442370 RepID=A0A0D2I6R7_CLAB1|nr:uncharacterized protein Z519_06356 [Cladophialophora bantiana CBS 173.52]KIW92509.1 hypothetical protein Z519_06356 [Cladophialophora bantiana CBS 173.52]